MICKVGNGGRLEWRYQGDQGNAIVSARRRDEYTLHDLGHVNLKKCNKQMQVYIAVGYVEDKSRRVDSKCGCLVTSSFYLAALG